MRLLPLLALAGALLAPAAASAQNTAQHMLESARQMRANAEKLRDRMPAEALAQMLKQADDIEAGVRAGDYGPLDAPAPPKPQTLAERLMAEHGRLEWLSGHGACAGYTHENFRTFRYNQAINDLDAHCRNAFGHWATYERHSRDGAAEAADQALFYYDAAARRAVEERGGN